jgi:hypothetical protein
MEPSSINTQVPRHPAGYYRNLPIPHPGKPPKARWWNQWMKNNLEAQIADSEKRVLWGWMNYAYYRRLFAEASDVLDGPLLETEKILDAEYAE